MHPSVLRSGAREIWQKQGNAFSRAQILRGLAKPTSNNGETSMAWIKEKWRAAKELLEGHVDIDHAWKDVRYFDYEHAC